MRLTCIAPISLDTKVSDTCRITKEKRRDGKEVDVEGRAASPDRGARGERRRACRADRAASRGIRAVAVPMAGSVSERRQGGAERPWCAIRGSQDDRAAEGVAGRARPGDR